jgi:uncharacterized low-complexity protein
MKRVIILTMLIGAAVMAVTTCVLANCQEQTQPNCDNVPNCTVLSPPANRGADGSCKSQTGSKSDCWCYKD